MSRLERRSFSAIAAAELAKECLDTTHHFCENRVLDFESQAMTLRLRDVIGFLDSTLEVENFRDYGPNGLQVEGSQEVDKVVTAVSVSTELFEHAAAVGADLIVVHHGMIWGGGLASVTGVAARRLRFLLERGISLAAYHLPLDAHPRFGNNVGLCDALALGAERDTFGDVRGHALAWSGSWTSETSRQEALAHIARGVLGGGQPQFVFPYGPETVRKIGLCSGAASDMLEDAAEAGCDLFLTGELAERAEAFAKELQITLVAAGHYNTEVFGPQRLVDALRIQFPGLDARFIGVPSPI